MGVTANVDHSARVLGQDPRGRALILALANVTSANPC